MCSKLPVCDDRVASLENLRSLVGLLASWYVVHFHFSVSISPFSYPVSSFLIHFLLYTTAPFVLQHQSRIVSRLLLCCQSHHIRISPTSNPFKSQVHIPVNFHPGHRDITSHFIQTPIGPSGQCTAMPFHITLHRIHRDHVIQHHPNLNEIIITLIVQRDQYSMAIGSDAAWCDGSRCAVL